MTPPAYLQEEETPKTAQRQLSTRYDGRDKVTGKAKYSAEFPVKDVVYACIVQSTIPKGTITAIDQTTAAKASGILTILTPFNAPKLPVASPAPPARRHITVLQEPDVFYNGQPIAVVVARSLPEAMHAATLLKITYSQQPALLNFKGRLSEARPPKQPGREPAENKRGDIEASLAKSTTTVDVTYTTPIQNHNPMEPHATLAWWDGDKLSVYDSTQYITGDRQTLARTFGIPVDSVHVQCPFVGGGFGSKGSTWSHVVLAAMASKAVGKPVKLALERNQMFGPVGSRPTTVQKIKLGATADGKLLAIQHDVIVHTSAMEDFLEGSAMQTRLLYSSESNATSHRLVDMNVGVGTFQRAPGEATGTAAFECAMDELAYKLNIDPVQLRLINYAEKDPGKDRPFTEKSLRQCYTQAAERFGWSKRNPKPGQMREGNKLIGYGMATATYAANRSAASAIVRILPTGRAFIGCGTQDLGTGAYTVLAQACAQGLGLDPKMVDVKLGDSTLPPAPVSGGSQSTASIGPAAFEAATQAKLKLFELAINDAQSPVHGLKAADLDSHDGKVFSKSAPNNADTIVAILQRSGGKPIEATASAQPGQDRTAYTSQSFGAVFVEVAVDVDTHMVQVRRVVGTYDIGTLLNQKTGINQLEGGITWGISFALHEESVIDPVHGRTVNESLAEYHVPVNADIGTMDITVTGIPDTKFSPQGARGIGEIGITGAAAAVGNAIFHATGKRVRDYPITLDKIMQA
jgi:xanthine dehydrogenase YagR molybdenum-binding subunit